MVRFEDLAVFTRAAALGSFSRAGREIGQPASRVSAAIKRLEKDLNARLFARSTRSLRLTIEGERYLPHAEKTLSTLREAKEALHLPNDRLCGLIRLSMPSDAGRNLLSSCLSAFRRSYPDVQLQVSLSDRVSQIFSDPVDAAIRYGRVVDGSFVALPLAPHNRRLLVAAPNYLDRRGRPDTLEALTQHDCLAFMAGGTIYDDWIFEPDGKRQTISIRSGMTSDDADLIRRWTIDGMGISYKSWLDVHEDIANGRLEPVLPSVTGELYPLNMICPHREQLSPIVRKLRETLLVYLSRVGLPSDASVLRK
jgi:DNA-binding transcriptional LysR family regulator